MTTSAVVAVLGVTVHTTVPVEPVGADVPPAAVDATDDADDEVVEVPRPAEPDAPPTWGQDVDGLLRFRGNLTHTAYGSGPLPATPEIAWRFPDRAMCITEAITVEETDDEGEVSRVPSTREWCGTGWTGQPVVRELEDGRQEVAFGGFDGLVYFLDGQTGTPTREPFRTGFQIKGTGSFDPDGYPLYYTGSRDGLLRILALDRNPVAEVWSMSAHTEGVWNNDWDGSPAIVDDVLYVGGEDSWFRAVRLNRDYDADGRVTVDPEVLVEWPAFDDELFAAIGDRNVSIENSVAIDTARDRLAFANSGGRVIVLRLSALSRGRVEVLLDVWLGDDIDASLVIDPADGALFAAVELQRFLPRANEVGQLVRLDVDSPADPIQWSVHVPPRRADEDGGIWATPALHGGLLYVATNPGELLVVDAATGEVVFTDELGWHAWSSPVVVERDGHAQLLVATCTDPQLRGYDLTDPRAPQELWRLPLAGCIESTPAVWDGRIWVGSRDGFFYGIH
ncbi:MAG: PQQ-binding-like beta-propeller repeat protein [Nitriliruptoraceae bacterium]